MARKMTPRKMTAALRLTLLLMFLITALVGAAAFGSGEALAAGFVVDSTADTPDAALDGTCDDGSGACTLRAAIEEANNLGSDDAITFAAGTDGSHIVLGSALPSIASAAGSGKLTIQGNGPANTIVDGAGSYQPFNVLANADLTFIGVTVTNGSGGDGGGIFNAGALTVQDSTISGNTASGNGGAILTLSSPLTINRSTFSDNSADFGGAIWVQDSDLTINNSTFSGNHALAGNGGALAGVNTVNKTWNISNSTFSDNSATGGGGAISANTIAQVLASTIVNLIHTTISNNSAVGGAVVAFSAPAPASTTINFTNSIVADQQSGSNCYIQGNGFLVSQDYNIASDTTCNFTQANDQQTNPLLGPLQDNGGPTETMALTGGSPAIDQIPVVNGSCNDTGIVADQRGVARPQGSTCDIGAFELREVDLSIIKERVAYYGPININAPASNADLPEVVIAGEEIIYRVGVYNSAQETAYGVIVTDDLPAELTYLDDTDSCVYDGGLHQLTCDLGDIDSYQFVEFFIKVRVNSDAVALTDDGTTVINNCAGVDSSNPETNLDNNSSCEATFVQDEADLAIIKMSKPDDIVQAGELFAYTIYVDNLGPSYARSVVIRDTMLASGIFELATQAETNAWCANPAGPGICRDPNRPDSNVSFSPTPEGGQMMTIALNQALEPWGVDIPGPAASGRWTIQVLVRANETQDINNIADVYTLPGGTPDPDTSNNQAIDNISILDTSDLSISKTTVQDPATAGLNLDFILRVRNEGPSTAANVVVKDFLPAGVQILSLTPDQGSCSAGTPGDAQAPVQCNLGTIPVMGLQDDPIEIDIKVTIDPDYPVAADTSRGPLVNSATVSSDNFDPDNGDNVDYTRTPVRARADLSLTKFAIGTPIAGTAIHYEFNIANLGPSVARDVTLRDFLPNEVRFLNAFIDYEGGLGGVPLPCTVTLGSNALFCPLGDIPLTGDVPILVFVNVQIKPDVPDGTVITNNADVLLSDTPDPEPGNNSDAASVSVQATADLEIEKTSEPEIVYAGELKKYTIKVTNHGPSDATDIRVIDWLPPEVAYQIDTDSCQVLDPQPSLPQNPPVPAGAVAVRCVNPGPLHPGQMWQFDIWALVDPATAAGTEIVNWACLLPESVLIDPNPDNDCDSSKNRVENKADLRVLKFGKMDGEVEAGDTLVYTVIIDNFGPSFASGVAVKDVLQSAGTFDLLDIYSDRDATCAGLPALGTANFPATPWPPNFSSTPGQTDPPGTGVDPANGGVAGIDQRLEVDCTLSNPLEVLAADGPPNSGRWILTMRVRANQTQDINNVATVLSEALDPDPDNNSAYVEHAITDVADLKISKTNIGEVQQSYQPGGIFDIGTPGIPFPEPPSYETDAGHVTAGRRIAYTLTVTNQGPSTAENVLVTDRLPPGVVIYPGSLKITPDVGSCQTGTAGEPLDRLQCGLGFIEPDGVVTIEFQVVTDSSLAAGTVLENDAFVTSDIFDPDNSDNHDFTQTVVNTWADLVVEKRSFGENLVDYDKRLDRDVIAIIEDSVTAGMVLRYQITVHNQGPSDALNVQVADVLPPAQDVTFLYAEDAQCSPQGLPDENTYICYLGTIPAGAAKTFQIYVATDPDLGGDVVLENNAWAIYPEKYGICQSPDLPGQIQPPVLPITKDPYTCNNHDDALTDVNVVADMALEKMAPAMAIAGEEIVYDITLWNNGPSVAGHVTFKDKLPPEVEYKFATIDGLNDLCRLEESDPDVVMCFPGAMKPGDETHIKIFGTVKASTPEGTIIENEASVNTDSFEDIQDYNNKVRAYTYIETLADLSITKFGKPDGTVNAGDELTYTVIVQNNGPSYARDVAVQDLFRSDGTFELLSVQSSRNAGCSPTSGVFDMNMELQCELWRLEVKNEDNPGRWILTYVIKATEKQDVNNVAEVRSSEADPDLSNNESAVQQHVDPLSDLSVAIAAQGEVQQDGQAAGTVSWVDNQVTAGRTMQYVITVSNTGVSSAQNVVLEDVLPSGVTPSSVVASKGGCSLGLAGEPTICGLGNMAPGAEETVTIAVNVPASTTAGSSLVSNATVYSDVPDAENAFNFAANLTAVNAWADLSLKKSNLSGEVAVGDEVQFKIEVRNDGPSDAVKALVTDVMPGEIADVSWACSSYGGGVCDASGSGDIMDEVDLPVSGWLVYTVTGTRTVHAGFSNKALVSPPAGVSDPLEGNNSGSAEVEEIPIGGQPGLVYANFLPVVRAND